MNCIMLLAKTHHFWIVKSTLCLFGIIMLLAWSPYKTQGASPLTTEEPSMFLTQQSDELKGESELPWLFAVFFISWAAFFAYVWMMSSRQRELRREIGELKVILSEINAKSNSGEHRGDKIRFHG